MTRSNDLPAGMIVRGRTYWADFHVSGRRVRKSLSANLKTARQLLIELRARAERGDFGLLDDDYSVAALVEPFMKNCKQTLKPGTVERYRYCLDAILPHLPARVSHVSIRAIMAYRDRRAGQGVGPGTINKEVKVAGTMFKWAVSMRLIGSNPLQGIKPLPHDRAKEGRALTPDEVRALFAASSKRYRDVWYAFLTTGMRKSELARLEFRDIDWENRELVVRQDVSKTHRARRIPLDDQLYEILRDLEAQAPFRKPAADPGLARRFSKDHVFVTRHNTPFMIPSLLYASLMVHCAKAGIETRRMGPDGHEIDHVDVHSLRRTFATDMIVNRADPKTVQELLGHTTLAMTMNLYCKVHGGTKRQAIARLSYGGGARAPEHLVDFSASEMRHRIPTNQEAPVAAVS